MQSKIFAKFHYSFTDNALIMSPFLKIKFFNREKEELISDLIIQVENLQDIMFSYQVDLFGPHELDAQYCCQLGKQIVDSCAEFIKLMAVCETKLGIQLVPSMLMRKIMKLQMIAQYGIIEYFKPGVLDSHINEIIEATFKKLGTPMPKRSSRAILQKLVQAAQRQRRQGIVKRSKKDFLLEVD